MYQNARAVDDTGDVFTLANIRSAIVYPAARFGTYVLTYYVCASRLVGRRSLRSIDGFKRAGTPVFLLLAETGLKLETGLETSVNLTVLNCGLTSRPNL